MPFEPGLRIDRREHEVALGLRARSRSRSSSRSTGTPRRPADDARPGSGSPTHRSRRAARSARTHRAPRRTASRGSQRARCSSVPQVTTGYCDRMWTDSDTAIAMSAAPSSSMTSVQAEVREAGPADRARERRRRQPERAHLGEQRPVVALRLVALDRPGCDLALREVARGRLEQPLLVAERRRRGGRGHDRSRGYV